MRTKLHLRLSAAYPALMSLMASGAVLVVAPQSAQAKFKVLYSFQGGDDGGHPGGALIQLKSKVDNREYLFGATYFGGAYRKGTVFSLAPDGSETIIHTFVHGHDGRHPTGSLIQDGAGNLYGSTDYGGKRNNGIVFRIAPDGTETIFHAFTGGDGERPRGLTLGEDGNLYGVTWYGGVGYGTVYRLTADGTHAVLHSFTNDDGAYPNFRPCLGNDGNILGATPEGGAYGFGTVFSLDADGNETVLHNFGHKTDGALPSSNLVMDAAGNLYGTTFYGGGKGTCTGNAGCGTVFEIRSNGKERILYAFAGFEDGELPSGYLVRDAGGNLYGTTLGGGANSRGIVFKVAPDGTKTDLHSFQLSEGEGHQGVIAGKRGRFYGASYGGGAHNYGSVWQVTE